MAERGAAPADEPRKLVPGGPRVTARLNYVSPSERAGGTDERKAKALRDRETDERLLPFPEGGPEDKEIAAVERRKARRSASWAGNPVR